MRTLEMDWQKTFWKILSNPALEVVTAIVVVLIATWFLVQGEAEQRHAVQFPLLFGRR